MAMHPTFMMSLDDFFIDIAFTIAAVIFCFLIYFRTREIYQLTKYEGIKYFRESFLFFGFSYVMRFLLGIVLLSRIVFGIVLNRELFGPIFILPLGYFSTMGIFCLLYSLLRRKFPDKKWIYLGHGIAILLSMVSFILRSHLILLAMQTLLLLAIIIIVIAQSKKKFSNTKLLYFLLSGLWLMNLWFAGPRRGFFEELGIVLDVVSLIVFFIIYHRITKWVK